MIHLIQLGAVPVPDVQAPDVRGVDPILSDRHERSVELRAIGTVMALIDESPRKARHR